MPKRADLSVTKTASTLTPNVGDNITFTITVSNAGPDAATNVTVADLLPSGYTYVSKLPSQGTYTQASGAWVIGTIANGGSATLTVTATVKDTGTYANTAQVNSVTENDPDSTPGNSAAMTDWPS